MTEPQISPEDRAFKAKIKAEWDRYQADPSTVHNLDLHRQILKTWQQTSPQMWARLQRLQMGPMLAYVVQQRMWTEMDDLMDAGLPVTDAREQAEQNQLMLEPEKTAA